MTLSGVQLHKRFHVWRLIRGAMSRNQRRNGVGIFVCQMCVCLYGGAQHLFGLSVFYLSSATRPPDTINQQIDHIFQQYLNRFYCQKWTRWTAKHDYTTPCFLLVYYQEMKQMNFKKDSTPRLYFFRFQYQEMNQINIKHDCFAHLYIYIYI